MSTPARHYLGLVTRSPQRQDGRYHWATVRPLVQSDEDGTKWQGPVTDAKVEFPKRGLLHWHAAPADVESGSIWQFVVEEISKADSYDVNFIHQSRLPSILRTVTHQLSTWSLQ